MAKQMDFEKSEAQTVCFPPWIPPRNSTPPEAIELMLDYSGTSGIQHQSASLNGIVWIQKNNSALGERGVLDVGHA